MSYSWVQTYWDNGFLAYWRLKQLPNFILASPIVILSVHSISVYLRSLEPKQPVYDYLGVLAPLSQKSKTMRKNYLLFPFAVHLAVLLVSVCFFMNVQVKYQQVYLNELR